MALHSISILPYVCIRQPSHGPSLPTMTDSKPLIPFRCRWKPEHHHRLSVAITRLLQQMAIVASDRDARLLHTLALLVRHFARMHALLAQQKGLTGPSFLATSMTLRTTPLPSITAAATVV